MAADLLDPASVELYIEDGPLGGRAFPFSSDRRTLVLGRGPQADVDFLDEEGMSRISRTHVRVQVRDGGVVLCDLQSRLGTAVDGEALSPGREVLVRPGARLQLAPPSGPHVLLRLRDDEVGRLRRDNERLRNEIAALLAERDRLRGELARPEEPSGEDAGRRAPAAARPEPRGSEAAACLDAFAVCFEGLQQTLAEEDGIRRAQAELSKVKIRLQELRELLTRPPRP